MSKINFITIRRRKQVKKETVVDAWLNSIINRYLKNNTQHASEEDYESRQTDERR